MRTLLAVFCLLACAVQAHAAARPELIAHGTADHLWVANVVKDSTSPAPGWVTRLQGRAIGQPWRSLGTLQGRVAALANRGGDLVVLFESGDWSLFWLSNGALTSSIGQPLAKGRILTIASDSRTLWAVARIPNRPATTQSSAAPSSQPATAQATIAPAGRLMLLSLDFNQWTWINHGELPRPFRVNDGRTMSLAVVDHRPVLALEGKGREIHLASYSSPRGTTNPSSVGWSPISAIRPDFAVDQFKLLGDSERPGSILLWVAPKAEAGVIYKQTERTWSGPIPLKAADPAKSAKQKTIALAAERLRLITQQGETAALYAQQFDMTGQPVGAQTTLGPPADRYAQLEFYLEIIMMAALVIAVLGTFYRRRQPPLPLSPEKLPLASLRARFGAGMIDAIPILISIVLAAMLLDGQANFSTANLDPRVNWILSGGFFVYLFYTTIVEMAAGRTIGKMILGLRVVTVDGKPADWSALLMRNILRLIDFLLAWFPLALIFYTPLRQRIGDVAAATVVVTNVPIPQKQEPTDPPQEQKPADQNETATK
jgi:uncharacterized RDD family membrane protein YckC